MKFHPRIALVLVACMAPATAFAQAVSDADLQKRANGILTLMGFGVTPDVTTGSLSLTDQPAGNPYFRQTSLSGGATLKSMPLYLEGTVGYGRYDPNFSTSDDPAAPRLAVKWESLLGTGGVGWDFPVAQDLVLRPIFNFSLGRVESAGSTAAQPAPAGRSATVEFLGNGRLNAYGLGGSLVLDYERYRPENEIDVELRYSNIYLQSFDSSQAVKGHADAQTLSLWSRYRAPTGMVALDRPVRYVLEYAYTRFLGDLDGALGFHYMNSFGAGLELDSSGRDVFVTRTRLMLRYKIGNNLSGWAIGLAASF